MSKVVHFDISALDTSRAIGFYQKTFGWKFNKAEVPGYGWFAQFEDPEGKLFSVMQFSQ